ncbi:hypothetical protein IPC65_02450 [Pseudomonas aeruginosa]|nr:hypothetical protein IPC64_15610 [Pseudomonas aeruginosa]TEQ11815.1 hypothetical protein IPC65_02450 [Pseudomonas aeruginosa]TEQ15515.1 hypothetical protein IPC66_08800 [Pseudomonas aeruginosa]
MRATFHDIRHFFFGPRPDKLPSRGKPLANQRGRQSRPVAWLDFKSGGGRQPFLGGFDSHCLPPILQPVALAALGFQKIPQALKTLSVEKVSKDFQCGVLSPACIQDGISFMPWSTRHTSMWSSRST